MKNQKDRLEAITSAGWTVELDCDSITIGKGEDVWFFDGGDFVEKALECVLYGEVSRNKALKDLSHGIAHYCKEMGQTLIESDRDCEYCNELKK